MNLSLPCYCVSERARHTDTVIECHVYCRHRFQICSTAGRLALCRSCRQHDHDRPHRHSRRRPPHQRRVLPQQRSGIRRHAGSAALDSFSSPQSRGGGLPVAELGDEGGHAALACACWRVRLGPSSLSILAHNPLSSHDRPPFQTRGGKGRLR